MTTKNRTRDAAHKINYSHQKEVRKQIKQSGIKILPCFLKKKFGRDEVDCCCCCAATVSLADGGLVAAAFKR